MPESNFNLPAAKAARDAAIDLIEEHTNPQWIVFMLTIIRDVARQRLYFTTDHVLQLASQRSSQPFVHDLRALGPLMLRSSRDRVCEATTEFSLCKRRSRHAAPIRVWRSLLAE
jgi:hypothetical protein